MHVRFVVFAPSPARAPRQDAFVGFDPVGSSAALLAPIHFSDHCLFGHHAGEGHETREGDEGREGLICGPSTDEGDEGYESHKGDEGHEGHE